MYVQWNLILTKIWTTANEHDAVYTATMWNDLNEQNFNTPRLFW